MNAELYKKRERLKQQSKNLNSLVYEIDDYDKSRKAKEEQTKMFKKYLFYKGVMGAVDDRKTKIKA